MHWIHCDFGPISCWDKYRASEIALHQYGSWTGSTMGRVSNRSGAVVQLLSWTLPQGLVLAPEGKWGLSELDQHWNPGTAKKGSFFPEIAVAMPGSPLNPSCWCQFPWEAEPFSPLRCTDFGSDTDLQEKVQFPLSQHASTHAFLMFTMVWAGIFASTWCSPTLYNHSFYLLIPHFCRIYCQGDTDVKLHPTGENPYTVYTS